MSGLPLNTKSTYFIACCIPKGEERGKKTEEKPTNGKRS